MNALNFAPMSSGTWDNTGADYNISAILTPQFTLNQTAMNEYSKPYWSPAYAMYFFCGFAATTGALLYAALWYGKSSYEAFTEAFQNRRSDYDDPYLQLMSGFKRVPHWWYMALLAICSALAIATIYMLETSLPWW